MRGALPLLLLASATIGCNSNKTQTAAPIVAAPTQPMTGGAQAAMGAPAPVEGISGKVLERLEASPYCYLRLKTAKGEVWAAIPEAKVEKGTEVTIVNPMLMSNFESKTLNRTFSEVYFGTLATPGTTAAPAPTGNPHAGVTMAASPVEVGKVDKATGGDARTIAEVWAQKGGLKEKTVTIRGKVVKYNPGVMGKNWIHLQDGSGETGKGTHDITVTSQDPAAKGDVVTIKGTVRLDKDFGAGYTYALIVEDAKVMKK
ncbi:MAG: hypothetical protein Q8K67_13495 [Geothrix sp.]|nr:hypothetical protein [Geothrix sp.]